MLDCCPLTALLPPPDIVRGITCIPPMTVLTSYPFSASRFPSAMLAAPRSQQITNFVRSQEQTRSSRWSIWKIHRSFTCPFSYFPPVPHIDDHRPRFPRTSPAGLPPAVSVPAISWSTLSDLTFSPVLCIQKPAAESRQWDLRPAFFCRNPKKEFTYFFILILLVLLPVLLTVDDIYGLSHDCSLCCSSGFAVFFSRIRSCCTRFCCIHFCCIHFCCFWCNLVSS